MCPDISGNYYTWKTLNKQPLSESEVSNMDCMGILRHHSTTHAIIDTNSYKQIEIIYSSCDKKYDILEAIILKKLHSIVAQPTLVRVMMPNV